MNARHLIAHSPLGFIVAFGAGMVSFLSPCVLPLVPGYLSMMSGVSATQLAGQSRPAGSTITATDQRKLLTSTLLFVAGFTLVFTALGATASTLGAALKDHQLGLNQAAGVVVIAFGLLLAGLVEPRFLQQERRFHVTPSRLGAFAPPLMGMAFAFGWTPCIGAPLAAVLGLAASEGTLARGVAMLVVYSLGLGVPFVLAGVAFGRLTTLFGWVKRHFTVINLVSGLLLVAFGLLLVTNHVTWLSGKVSDLLDFLGLRRLTTA